MPLKSSSEEGLAVAWEDASDGTAAVAVPSSPSSPSTAALPTTGDAAPVAPAFAPAVRDRPAAVSVSFAGSPSAGRRWAELPQDLGVLVCQCLGPSQALKLLTASRKMQALAVSEEVWRFFCRWRWGSSANLGVYGSGKDLWCDRNGWFPLRSGKRETPAFDVQHIRLRDSPCLTMDLRFTDDEIIAVSEAERSHSGGGQARVHIVDPETRRLRECFEVSSATINCCDVGPGLICLGSNDSKVRLYRRSANVDDGDSVVSFGGPGVGTSSGSSRGGLRGAGIPPGAEEEGGGYRYQLMSEYLCASEVNDLRFAREDAVIAVRTHGNRHPAGLDVIPLARPDVRFSFPGGSRPTRGKFIHALDGFEDGCSLSMVACSGEHPSTSAFSAMLLDFRRSAPCVADLPVTSLRQGHPVGSMLWPLRAGTSPKVYANVLHADGRRNCRGTIAMVDFRYPSPNVCVTFELPDQVDDFRCFGGSIYAACTQGFGSEQRLAVHRCSHAAGGGAGPAECISTVLESYSPKCRLPAEDLKVFSVCSRGFVVSYGEHIALGTVAAPSWRMP